MASPQPGSLLAPSKSVAESSAARLAGLSGRGPVGSVGLGGGEIVRRGGGSQQECRGWRRRDKDQDCVQRRGTVTMIVIGAHAKIRLW